MGTSGGTKGCGQTRDGRYFDEFFTLPAAEAFTVRHGVGRLVCNPERFERDEVKRAGFGGGFSLRSVPAL